MAARQMNSVYASGLTIPDRGLLATLTLLYDRVWLPHPYDLDPEARPLMRWPGKYWDDLESAQRGYVGWKDSVAELFNAGVLEVMPLPLAQGANDPADLSERLREELGIRVPHFNRSVVLGGRVALALHALYARTDDPEFLLEKAGDTGTHHLRGVLGRTLLEYRVPRLGELPPEEILRLREEIAPHKQGFVNYLSQMVDEVEGRLTSAGGDARDAARRAVERKISPELDEFFARELPERVKWWAKAVKIPAAVGKAFIKIVVTPWDISNYPDVVETISDGADYFAEQAAEKVSNKHRAFQYIGAIERLAGRPPGD